MDLQTLYLDPVCGRYRTIKSEMIPMILERSGRSIVCIAYKNTSDYIINNIEISTTGAPASLAYVLTNSSLIPSESDFQTNWELLSGNQLLETLFPGETIKFYLKVDYQSNVGIDLANFSLDLTYLRSHIPLVNLHSYFEFTEPIGAITISSSYPEYTTTVPPNSIKGNGRIYFQYDTASFSYSRPVSISEGTIFIKGIFEEQPSNQVLISSGNFELGLNSDRRVYLKIGSEERVFARELIDYNKEYLIGLSLTNITDSFLTVDGSLSGINTYEGSTVDFSIASSSSIEIGDNLLGSISLVAVYTKFENIAFHNISTRNLSGK